ncbi:MAG: guanitoxin biosynthesis heme-dependent pre-guanitoxin N-hydroxylase GntA [Gemmatimonadales bacterium]
MNVSRAQRAFAAFIRDPSFPCLGAKGALRQGGCRVGLYGSLGSAAEAERLATDLGEFNESFDNNTKGLTAFAAMFPDQPPETEISFETSMWKELQSLHEHDVHAGQWARDASDDPADPDFSFSFGGRAFFIIGLHPASSRIARRFEMPTLVFNPRSQFTQLRDDGRFEPLKSATRARDIALQGDLNPNLADFGSSSEARQYSGRKVEDDWACPFHRKAP